MYVLPLYSATALTELDTSTINKLLTALNECTEWGQVFILDSLAGYDVRLLHGGREGVGLRRGIPFKLLLFVHNIVHSAHMLLVVNLILCNTCFWY